MAGDQQAEIERLKTLLREADELLQIAYYAYCKMGLRDRGSDCRLSHEVRMFALNFSDQQTPEPEGVFRTGNGRYRSFRQRKA